MIGRLCPLMSIVAFVRRIDAKVAVSLLPNLRPAIRALSCSSSGASPTMNAGTRLHGTFRMLV